MGVIQRLYDYFVSDNKGKERVKAMLDACAVARVHIPLASAVSAEGAVEPRRRTALLRATPKRGQVVLDALPPGLSDHTEERREAPRAAASHPQARPSCLGCPSKGAERP